MITFIYFERENLTKTNVSQKSVGIRTGKSELLLTVMLASHPSISDSGSLLCSEYEMRSGRGERLQPLHHYLSRDTRGINLRHMRTENINEVTRS